MSAINNKTYINVCSYLLIIALLDNGPDLGFFLVSKRLELIVEGNIMIFL